MNIGDRSTTIFLYYQIIYTMFFNNDYIFKKTEGNKLSKVHLRKQKVVRYKENKMKELRLYNRKRWKYQHSNKSINEFELRPVTYQSHKIKILFASGYIADSTFHDWHRHREGTDTSAYAWDDYVSFLQENIKSLHMRLAKVGQVEDIETTG